jgi:hypothetical protein
LFAAALGCGGGGFERIRFSRTRRFQRSDRNERLAFVEVIPFFLRVSTFVFSAMFLCGIIDSRR